MKKVKYYKKIIKDKIYFSECWGEPLDVSLPNGKTLHLVCEFIRGDGWRITDMETGLLSQNKYISSKKELTEYIKDKNFLSALSKATNGKYYERQKDELNQFLESRTCLMSI